MGISPISTNAALSSSRAIVYTSSLARYGPVWAGLSVIDLKKVIFVASIAALNTNYPFPAEGKKPGDPYNCE